MSSSDLRPYHHGNLRDALLDSADRVLRAEGVEGLSLRQVARDCGVSSAAPRRHFPTKQALLDELAVGGFRQLARSMTDVAQNGTVEERLRAIAAAYLDFAANNGELLELMFTRKHVDSQDPRVVSAAGDTMAVIRKVIQEGQRDGSIAQRDPDELVLTFFTVTHGLVSLAATGVSEPAAVSAQMSAVIDLIFEGIRPR
ncbi:TetR/AcrR family transcriptional regulator [Gordonia sp. CPCC 205333]|uniref:TetR/AcrR family transcriptional regulator n=1 Tax=Gordonia sp. CPCC 205333 TaxID=3140790 RepID=UPI003AF39195